MARQHMHNRRAARGTTTGGGASWISYSDMMAALLLIFVLILCYSLYQYFTMLEQKSAELELQQIILTGQQKELDEKEQILIVIQADLDNLQDTLKVKESELEEANTVLLTKEQELEALQLILSSKQEELDNAMLRLSEQQQALDAQAARIDDLVGVRGQIIRDLSSALTQSELKSFVDPNTGDIILDSSIFFETARFEIKQEGKDLLSRFVPVYLNVLLRNEYSDYLGEIIIEGHTDSSGTYYDNLVLSQKRALAVANFCLSLDGLTSAQKKKFQEMLTVTGRSYSDLKYDEYGAEDANASRRVEFKFRLKDAEMINEMDRILHSEDGE